MSRVSKEVLEAPSGILVGRFAEKELKFNLPRLPFDVHGSPPAAGSGRTEGRTPHFFLSIFECVSSRAPSTSRP